MNQRIRLSLSILFSICTYTIYSQQVIPSDGRFTFNIREDVRGLDFINKLKPVTYQFDLKKYERLILKSDATYALYDFTGEKISKVRRTGFIAQDVEVAAKESGYSFNGVLKPVGKREHYVLNYDALVVPLVKAVQEQQETITNQQLRIISQDKKIYDLQRDIRSMEEKLDKLIKILEKSTSAP